MTKPCANGRTQNKVRHGQAPPSLTTGKELPTSATTPSNPCRKINPTFQRDPVLPGFLDAFSSDQLATTPTQLKTQI